VKGAGLTTHRYAPEALLAVAIAVSLLVALTVTSFPFEDAMNHLARYLLMDRALFGPDPGYVSVRLLPTPYIGLDLVGVGLVHTLGPDATLRVLGLAALAAPPLGMYVLLRATAPERRGWALVGALMGFNAFLLAGFLNYVVAVGLALAWLGFWWPRRATRSLATRLALGAGAALVFLVHLAPLLALVVVIGVHALLTVLTRRPSAQADTKAVLATVATIVAVVAAVYAAYRLTLPPPHDHSDWHFRTLLSKVKNLLTPFYSLSAPQLAVMLLGFVASALAYQRATRGLKRLETFTVSALVLLAIYFVFPMDRGNTGPIDARWLLPAALLPFCAAGTLPTRAPSLLWIPFAASLVHAAVMAPHLRRVDRDLRAYERAIALLPPGGTLLTLVADSARHGRPLVLRGYGHRYTIRSGGRVPGLYVAEGYSPESTPNEQFAHFREPARLYFPEERWKRAAGVGLRRPTDGHWYDVIIEDGYPEYIGVDRTRIAREYDYIIVAGRDPAVRALVPAGAKLMGVVSTFAVFATGRPAGQVSPRKSP
jgi:hypothetical protein